MIVTTKKLFEAAYGKYAIGAYNINNLEQTMGLFQGNLNSQAPFILQISKGARSYSHKTMLEGLIRSADEIFIINSGCVLQEQFDIRTFGISSFEPSGISYIPDRSHFAITDLTKDAAFLFDPAWPGKMVDQFSLSAVLATSTNGITFVPPPDTFAILPRTVAQSASARAGSPPARVISPAASPSSSSRRIFRICTGVNC